MARSSPATACATACSAFWSPTFLNSHLAGTGHLKRLVPAKPITVPQSTVQARIDRNPLLFVFLKYRERSTVIVSIPARPGPSSSPSQGRRSRSLPSRASRRRCYTHVDQTKAKLEGSVSTSPEIQSLDIEKKEIGFGC